MALKGHIPWNKGKTGVYKKEHIEFLKNKNKGQKLSQETKDKISRTKKGTKAWNKGIPVSKEMKERISKTLKEKGISKEWRERMRIGQIGKYRGEKSHSWKGGKTSESYRIRRSTEMSLWRKSVFERDNFICQKYGTSGGKLNAHHINNFSEYPEIIFAIDNGITLSEKAHKEFHKKYGFKHNTIEQIKEFLCTDLEN